MNYYRPSLIIGFILICSNVCAKQTNFEKLKLGSEYQFNYKWLDARSAAQELSFKLDAKNVNGDFRHFKALKPSLLHMYSVKKLKQAVAQLDPRKGTVKIKQRPNRVEFEIRSTNRDWINEQNIQLSSLYQSALKEILHSEYYVEFPGFSKMSSTTTYKPDHLRFAKESGDALSAIIEQIRMKMPRATARQISAYILSWIQTIPYSEIESRAESNGAGFLPPIKVIANNKGDCDSKVTLMASLLKKMFSRLRVAIIYIPGHALIGLNVSHLSKDYKLEINGLDYTLSEPVGPGVLKFATISERSKRYIESGNYLVELL